MRNFKCELDASMVILSSERYFLLQKLKGGSLVTFCFINN